MLQQFLDRLASITGRKYTKAEFGEMILEGIQEAKTAAKAAKAETASAEAGKDNENSENK